MVDTGMMLTFDIKLALESVSNLKDTIWKEWRIPVDRQVMLVSGGECLSDSGRVCSYAAGTDTNPIFLLNKTNIETSPTSSGQNNAPSPTTDILAMADVDNIKDQIDGCLALPPTLMTVVARAQLSSQIHDMARDITRRCENLIADQHLQHQGWAAVVANLEDLITAFKARSETFETSFKEYLLDKDEKSKVLLSFESDIGKLESIKVISSLIPHDIPHDGIVSLKDWIISLDQPNKLDDLKRNCVRHLEKLDASVLDTIQKESIGIIDKAGLPSMKEIKGLEERLYGLDQLLQEAKKLVQEQYDLFQAFLQNQHRANDIKDASILPDLCQSHQHQLLVMQRNHQQLEDIRRRCAKAKEELSVNLNARLRWIIFIQRSITECGNKITVYQESLKRLKCHIDIIEQIHTTSELYVEAVFEVVRRKKFSEFYSQWANSVADKMEKIHNDEINRRNNFTMRFDNHFLTMLFPGLDEFPSPFANQRPTPFDMNLPQISNEEYESVKKIFPDRLFDEDGLDLSIEFPLSSGSDHQHTSKSAENLSLKMEVETLQLEIESKKDELDELDKKYQESQEGIQKENEKLSELTAELTKIKDQLGVKDSTLNDTQCQIKVLEEKVGNLQLELEKLNELNENYEKEKATYQDLEKKFEEEKSEFIDRVLQEKDSELRDIKDSYKQDLESLRSRFKLVTSIEGRSPSMENVEKSFEIGKTEEIITDMSRIMDVLQTQTQQTNALTPTTNPLDNISQLLRNVLIKVETTSAISASSSSPKPQSPALKIRARVNSAGLAEGSQRQSIDTADEDGSMMRSVFNLDTSAIDATAMCREQDENGPFSEMVTPPPEKIIQIANKLAAEDKITQVNCKVGDNILIYWNDKFNAYLVCLNNKNVHFLHTECLKALGHNNNSLLATSPPAIDNVFIAQVTDKEFCVARRSQNRYRVPQGFHFYRVRVLVIEKLEIASFL